jgi:purine-binding chemotaxis protein CheW
MVEVLFVRSPFRSKRSRLPRVTPANENTAYLVVAAQGRSAAIELDFVVETMRPLPTRAVASASNFVVGVAVARGEATAVVDLGALLSGRRSASAERFVSVRAGSRRVLLAVDRVIGVKSFDASLARAMPPLLAGADEDSVAALATLDHDLLYVLRAARVVELSAEVAS